MFKKIFIIIILTIFSLNAFANTPRSTGKYKNWESFVAETDKGKICFAQTIPIKRAPAAVKRDVSKLFVTFRPSEEIKDEDEELEDDDDGNASTGMDVISDLREYDDSGKVSAAPVLVCSSGILQDII